MEFAGAIVAHAQKDVQVKQAQYNFEKTSDMRILLQLNEALNQLNKQDLTKSSVIAQLEALISIVNQVRGGEQ